MRCRVAALQGPTPSVGYEVRGQFNDHRYEDRQGFEGFAVRPYVTRVGQLVQGRLQPEPSMLRFLTCVSNLKKSNERMFTLLQALDVPTVYNVWRRK